MPGLSPTDLALYRRFGHHTVPPIFDTPTVDRVNADIDAWGNRFIAGLSEAERHWYLSDDADQELGLGHLRKLDNPHVHSDEVIGLARSPQLIDLVESLIGPGVSVYFSQVFMKPPGGGPKPAHQDNFYFGPNDPDGMVTAWIALDDATLENGCLYFGAGSNLGPVYPHWAPENEPFNLQLHAEVLERQPMSPAPVRRGGASFHHGNTFHQSGPNTSDRSRRACALHYVRNDVSFVEPALDYDHSIKLQVST